LDDSVALEKGDKVNVQNSLDAPGPWGWTLATVVEGHDNLFSQKHLGADEEEKKVGLSICCNKSMHNGQKLHVPVTLLRSSEGSSLYLANDMDMADEDAVDGSSSLPPDDLIDLTHVNEPSVVDVLSQRYEKDVIYTHTASNLLAVNPYKEIPDLYGHAVMETYWLAGEGTSFDDGVPTQKRSSGALARRASVAVPRRISGAAARTISDGRRESGANVDGDEADVLPPHVYGISDHAFRCMMSMMEGGESDITLASLGGKLNQTIVITGDSGAGKTTASRHVVEYTTRLSMLRSRAKKLDELGYKGRKTLSQSTQGQSAFRLSRNPSMARAVNIELRVVQSSPILESFGNARTFLNDNSSRFGKFVELQFKENGSLIGAAIETYLLEKVRLVSQSRDERNFHIFYEFLASATEEERKKYLLDELTAKDFTMTCGSGTFDRRDNADDSEQFDELVDALGLIGIGNNDMEYIFSLLSALLHISNLTLLSVNDEESKVEQENEHLDQVLTLLGLEYDALDAALTSFSIQIRNQEYVRKLPKEKAEKGLEALAKALYGALFKYIVRTINDNMRPSSTDKKAGSIGMLDVAGFEHFERNSFEQLCINYCNEVLQQQFIKLVFLAEQREYQREGIDYSEVVFGDNKEVLDLIDKKGHGIIAILHDQCKVPGTSDRTFATNIYQQFQSHPRFKASRKQKANQMFSIVHYAGSVEYDITGFVEKNKDEVPKEGSQLLESSSNPFVRKLCAIITEHHKPITTGAKFAQNRGVGHELTTQLRDIRDRIDATQPHYIRCFKPNSDLRPGDFQPALIANQLRYAGVLEALLVSRNWFPHRYKHAEFYERYHQLAKDELKDFNGSEREKCQLLVNMVAFQIWELMQETDAVEGDDESKNMSFRVDNVGLQVGKTKVFLRHKTFEYLEYLRGRIIVNHVNKINALLRGRIARKQYKKRMTALMSAQTYARRFIAVLKAKSILRRNAAATKIQKTWRGGRDLARYKLIKLLVAWTQAHFRGWEGREQFRQLQEDQKKRKEEQKQILQEKQRKLEEEQRKLQEKQKKLEEEQKKMEEEQKKVEEEQRKLEEEKKQMEEEQRKAEEEQRKMEEEQRKAGEERRKMEEEQRKAEEEQRKAEEEQNKNVQKPQSQDPPANKKSAPKPTPAPPQVPTADTAKAGCSCIIS